ncbi:hypothetical protein [Pseudonocardia spinosispora]|uniref:hypothetical protein n=1 Tax=Pseudonocardia spinosispora TaxID=103441 RepID=UPI000490CDC1|nr:hypothetical protein [Pseudonocardia spinosispora]
MNSRRVFTYVAASAAAVCTVGAVSATAWASTPVQDVRHPVVHSVTAKQCHATHGKVIKVGKGFTCKGGKSDHKPVRG